MSLQQIADNLMAGKELTGTQKRILSGVNIDVIGTMVSGYDVKEVQAKCLEALCDKPEPKPEAVTQNTPVSEFASPPVPKKAKRAKPKQ